MTSSRPLRWHSLSLAAGLTLLVSLASPASADVIPPDVMSCDGRAAGAACMNEGLTGTCTAARCTRLDYAGWDRDASPSPPPIEYDCVRCVTSAGTDAGMDTPPRMSTSSCSAGAAGAGGAWGALFVAAAIALLRRR